MKLKCKKCEYENESLGDMIKMAGSYFKNRNIGKE